MRILHCIPTLTSGGAERQLSVLVPAQRARGAEVHVAYARPGLHLAALQASGASLHQLEIGSSHDPRIFTALWSLVSSVRPDIVHSWLPQMDIVAGSIALCRGIPWVLAERSSEAAYLDRFKDRVVRAALGRWADAVVANSRAGERIWSGRLRRGARAHVVRNALPLEAIAATAAASLADLGVVEGRRAVIFVGRLTEAKNIGLLVAVACGACAGSDADFLICGDGPLREQVEAQVRGAGMSGRIRVLGEREDVWALLKASSAFVSTSSFEGQPNAVLEAMACGCPLVVSDIAAHREFLDESTAAIVPLEAGRFVDAVLEAIGPSETAARRARAAKAQIARQHPASAAAEYEVIYREAVLRHQRCVE